MSESEPIAFRPREAGYATSQTHRSGAPAVIAFSRHELNAILAVYGRKVAAGDWRDYALDLGPEKAVFSVFRRASEFPLYRIEKNPRLARRQGAFSVVSATGHILKRGHDLERVLRVLETSVRLVD